MDRFHLYEKIYLSTQLTAAYEDACRKLGINPLRMSADAEPHQLVRDQVARALLNAAQRLVFSSLSSTNTNQKRALLQSASAWP
jgi:hypothetical protein